MRTEMCLNVTNINQGLPTEMEHYYVVDEKEIAVRNEPVPEVASDEVLIETAYTALSPGSNLHSYRTGGSSASDVLYMGSGIVRDVGSMVERFTPGDRVAGVPMGHQEYNVLPETEPQLVSVPADVDLKAASISYLSAWAVSALHLCSYAAAENVVVVGQGLVGTSAALVAHHMGARVVTLDIDPVRVEHARNLGVGPTVNPNEDHSAENITDFLGDRGADIIIETSGAWSGLVQAISLARDYTRIPIMGIYRNPPSPEQTEALHDELFAYPSTFHYQRLNIIGCGSDPDEVGEGPQMATRRRNYDYVLEQAAAGSLALDRLVTHCFPAAAIESTLDRMVAGDAKLVGVVFDWNS